MSDEQDEIYNAMGHELRRNLSLVQARWELAVSHQRLLEALATANPRGLDAALYGEAGLVRAGHDEDHAGWIKRWRGEKGI